MSAGRPSSTTTNARSIDVPQFSYLARPAKHIQRLLVFDACRRLSGIAPLRTYAYVGFGGLEFADFVLARTHLGIEDMTSIEKNATSIRRYEFNVPFAKIRVLGGRARDRLTEIDFSGLVIVW